MSALLTYLLNRRLELARSYDADCLAIARDIARLLIDDGKHPSILCIKKEEDRAGGRFHYPLVPKRYGGRITWTRHYVCFCEGLVYDPMLGEPVRIEQYSRKAFGEEFPIETIAGVEEGANSSAMSTNHPAPCPVSSR